MKNKNILAIDLGTTTGWALFKKDAQGVLKLDNGLIVDAPVTSGFIKLRPKGPLNSHIDRCNRLEQWLKELPQQETMVILNKNMLSANIKARGYEGSIAAEGYTINHKIDIVYFEIVQFDRPGLAAKHLYGALKNTLERWCCQQGIKCVPVGVKIWKKVFYGNGNADKEMVIAKAREAYKPTVKDDNEADALGILHYAMTLDEV